MENRPCGTSHISDNKTDKPERMRWSCAVWFCGEEKKINAAWLDFKFYRRLRKRRRRRRYIVEDVAIQ